MKIVDAINHLFIYKNPNMKDATNKLKQDMISRLLKCLQAFLLVLAATIGFGSHAQTITYIHTDGLGSPVAKSDAAGFLVANSRTRYEPYGQEVAGTATPTIGFTGHVNDADSGLTYMQQRYYDPVAGRFLSSDPVLTDNNSGASFNRYSYANNNPYRYIDPDGREPENFKKEVDAARAAREAAEQSKLANKAPPPLSLMHSDSVIKSASGNYSSLKKESTEKIVESLKPGKPEPLKVDKDGKVWDGNTRVAILKERGVDVNKLPRTTYSRSSTGGMGLMVFVTMYLELGQAISELPPKQTNTPAVPNEQTKNSDK